MGCRIAATKDRFISSAAAIRSKKRLAWMQIKYDYNQVRSREIQMGDHALQAQDEQQYKIHKMDCILHVCRA